MLCASVFCSTVPSEAGAWGVAGLPSAHDCPNTLVREDPHHNQEAHSDRIDDHFRSGDLLRAVVGEKNGQRLEGAVPGDDPRLQTLFISVGMCLRMGEPGT